MSQQLNLALRSKRDLLSRIERACAAHFIKRQRRLKNELPVASFTFDDIPVSALEQGARVLEDEGVRGTFYIAGGLCGNWSPRWRFIETSGVGTLIDAGHEIGCHSFSHPDLQTLSQAQAREQFKTNAAFLADVDARTKLNNFAYPYGSTGIRQKTAAIARFLSCRGTRPYINRQSADLGQLGSILLNDDKLPEAELERVIASAAQPKTWLIFHTHDVEHNPTEHGCSPDYLRYAVRAAKQHGFEIVPVRDALRLAGLMPV